MVVDDSITLNELTEITSLLSIINSLLTQEETNNITVHMIKHK